MGIDEAAAIAITTKNISKARLDPAISARIVSSAPLARTRAGSALVRIESESRLLAVQDDAFTLLWIDPETRAEEPLILRGTGEALPKPEKPDFEAAVVAEGGVVYVLGSGSAQNRRWIARLNRERLAAELIAAGHLYDVVAEALGVTPNIEGAVLAGPLLRLFHRGSGRAVEANPSAIIDVAAEALDGIAAVSLAVARYDLGSIDGVPLAFTDAAPFDDRRRSLYVAVAEDTPDAIADGPIVGAAIGVLNENGARYARLEMSDGSLCTKKPEGIALDPGGRSGFLITDPDSPTEPAELCRFVLEGPW